jgi:myo-inositol catabolism protein IolC
MEGRRAGAARGLRRAVAAARAGGRAAAVPGFVGFAVGRTVFWDPLVAWRSKRTTRDQTIAEIARRYRQFVDLFERKDANLSSVASSSMKPEYRASMEG